MVEISLELPVNAKPETIWRVYSEFALRRQWETDLESFKLDGPFATGGSGVMQLTGMPPIRFVFTDVQPLKSFRDAVDLKGLGQLEFGHEISERDGQRFVRHSIAMLANGGKLTNESYAFFQKVSGDLTDVLWRLKILAESL